MGRYYKQEEFKPMQFEFKLPADTMWKIKSQLDKEFEANIITPIAMKTTPQDAPILANINKQLMDDYNSTLDAMRNGEFTPQEGLNKLREIKLTRTSIAQQKDIFEQSQQNYDQAVKKSSFTEFFDVDSYNNWMFAKGKQTVMPTEDGYLTTPQAFDTVDFGLMGENLLKLQKFAPVNVKDAMTKTIKNGDFIRYSQNDPSGMWYWNVMYSDPKMKAALIGTEDPEVQNIFENMVTAQYKNDDEAYKKYSNELYNYIGDEDKFRELLDKASAITSVGKELSTFAQYVSDVEQAYKEGRITEEQYRKMLDDYHKFQNYYGSALGMYSTQNAYNEAGVPPRINYGSGNTNKKKIVRITGVFPNKTPQIHWYTESNKLVSHVNKGNTMWSTQGQSYQKMLDAPTVGDMTSSIMASAIGEKFDPETTVLATGLAFSTSSPMEFPKDKVDKIVEGDSSFSITTDDLTKPIEEYTGYNNAELLSVAPRPQFGTSFLRSYVGNANRLGLKYQYNPSTKTYKIDFDGSTQQLSVDKKGENYILKITVPGDEYAGTKDKVLVMNVNEKDYEELKNDINTYGITINANIDNTDIDDEYKNVAKNLLTMMFADGSKSGIYAATAKTDDGKLITYISGTPDDVNSSDELRLIDMLQKENAIRNIDRLRSLSISQREKLLNEYKHDGKPLTAEQKNKLMKALDYLNTVDKVQVQNSVIDMNLGTAVIVEDVQTQ